MRPSLYLQLWSLRHSTSTDAEGALRQVRGLGYDGVELAGDYGWSAERWRAVLDETGLRALSAHVGLDSLEGDLAAKLAFYRALGTDCLIVPSLNRELQTSDGYREAARRLNTLGAQMKAAGFRLGYHNHDFEFAQLPGTQEVGMDILLANTDPALVGFEFDAFWLELAGRDAVEFAREHRRRVLFIHAKDLRKRDRQDVPAGQGDVDFRTLVPLCTANGWPVVVEYEGANATGSVREGAAYLRNLLG